jgi:hypothetical protein
MVAAAVIGIGAANGATGLAGPVAGGMAGPVVAVVATWIAVVRVYRRDPSGVIALMVWAFLVKAVFFSVYVVAMIRVAGLPARAFGVSFVAFFIGLYAAEAVLFVRLFRPDMQGSR